MTKDKGPSDEELAQAFIETAGTFRFDPTSGNTGTWFVFGGSTWRKDTGNNVAEIIGTLTESDAKVASTLRRLKTKSDIQRTAWDGAAHLIGCNNGVYDLTADSFRAGALDDYLTIACPVAYHAHATAPRWERFLTEVFEPTPDVPAFLQELLGYMLTGYTDPHHVTFFHGAGGRNGKSTLCNILRYVMGDYAWTFNAERIFAKKTEIPNDVADFKGRRFVYSNELPKQVKLTSTLVKLLSGGDTIVARQLYHANENIPPTWHMVIVSNHIPTFDDDGDALWDRVLCIPFAVRFVGAKQDPTLDATLKAEAQGILNWLIEGARRYIANGRRFSSIPDAVRASSEQMREVSRSPIDAFYAECVVRDDAGQVEAKTLFTAYEDWYVSEGYPITEKLSSTKFGRDAGERYRRTKSAKANVYVGIRLKGSVKESPQQATMRQKFRL